MSETDVAEALTQDCFEIRFSNFYGMKNFAKDAARLRDLHKLAGRERLSEDETAELSEIRRRLKRADTDSALLFVLNSRSHGGLNLL